MKRLVDWLTRYLDIEDILLEVIFGLLVVMTFTMAFRALETRFAPEDLLVNQVQHLLIAAIGCTLAWGLIDAVITVLTNVATRAQQARIITRINASTREADAMAIVAGELDEELTHLTSEVAREALYRDIAETARTIVPEEQGITRDDVLSAVVVIVAAMTATLPALIPYLFVTDPMWAIRLSNLTAIAMLFAVGYAWAKATGGKPLKVGLLVSIVGVVITLIAIPLGG